MLLLKALFLINYFFNCISLLQLLKKMTSLKHHASGEQTNQIIQHLNILKHDLPENAFLFTPRQPAVCP